MSQGTVAPISAATRLCAVYGSPVRHSASPAMQNAGMASLALDWRYLACEVPPERLREALTGAAAMRWVGVNLTVPHKLLAVPMMDLIDPAARVWGAVNTVRFEARDAMGEWVPIGQWRDGPIAEVRLHGFNTDADAIVRSIREDLGCELRGSRVLLLGAGGAGRVAALRLAAEGVRELFLVNRTESKAAAIAEEIPRLFPQSPTQVRLGYPTGAVDLVLNATSAGLRETDPLPWDGEAFSLGAARMAYDMIYKPAETRFLAAAKAAGCRVSNGLGMLLYQGAAALELWSGQIAPVDVMRLALFTHVYGATR